MPDNAPPLKHVNKDKSPPLTLYLPQGGGVGYTTDRCIIIRESLSQHKRSIQDLRISGQSAVVYRQLDTWIWGGNYESNTHSA